MLQNEKYFREEELVPNVKVAAYFILLYEHFEDMVIETVREFYSTPCMLDGKPFSNIDKEYIDLLEKKVKQGESGRIPFKIRLADARRKRAIYQKEVLSKTKMRDARVLRASLNWLQDHQVISGKENNNILETRMRRNELVHGLLQEIGKGFSDEDAKMIADMLNVQQRINAWRFQQIDMSLMEIKLPEGANPNDVMGSDDMILNVIFRILFCGEGEKFKEALDEELKK